MYNYFYLSALEEYFELMTEVLVIAEDVNFRENQNQKTNRLPEKVADKKPLFQIPGR